MPDVGYVFESLSLSHSVTAFALPFLLQQSCGHGDDIMISFSTLNSFLLFMLRAAWVRWNFSTVHCLQHVTIMQLIAAVNLNTWVK